MAEVKCPIRGYDYIIPELDAALAAVMLSGHLMNHKLEPPLQTARVEKVNRPNISSGGSTEDWMYFKSRWGDYVKATKLTGPDLSIQLLECCDDQLRRDLTRNAGGTLADQTEEQIFGAIKTLAVREENVMIARTTLHEMRQDRDEPVRAFGARLRGQASVCKFIKKCTHCNHWVDYAEDTIADVLCRGIADLDIRQTSWGNQTKSSLLSKSSSL